MTPAYAIARSELERCLALLKRARYFVAQDVAMVSAITRHSPLASEEQAKFDSTETESELLLPEIDELLKEYQ